MLHHRENLGLKFKCDNFYTIGIKKYKKHIVKLMGWFGAVLSY